MTFTIDNGREVTSLKEYLEWLLFESDVHLLEFWTSLTAVAWGLWLANPEVVLFGTVPPFQYMAWVAPEWVWGTVLALAGLFSLLGLFKQSSVMRHRAALIQSALWVCVFLALALENWRWLSSVVYPSLAMASWWVSCRANRGDGDDPSG